MGIDFKFHIEFSKAQIAANQKLPLVGTNFLSLSDFTKPSLLAIANGFIELGLQLLQQLAQLVCRKWKEFKWKEF